VFRDNAILILLPLFPKMEGFMSLTVLKNVQLIMELVVKNSF